MSSARTSRRQRPASRSPCARRPCAVPRRERGRQRRGGHRERLGGDERLEVRPPSHLAVRGGGRAHPQRPAGLEPDRLAARVVQPEPELERLPRRRGRGRVEGQRDRADRVAPRLGREAAQALDERGEPRRRRGGGRPDGPAPVAEAQLPAAGRRARGLEPVRSDDRVLQHGEVRAGERVLVGAGLVLRRAERPRVPHDDAGDAVRVQPQRLGAGRREPAPDGVGDEQAGRRRLRRAHSPRILAAGAVLRRTSDSGAHAAGRSGGKGGSSLRDTGPDVALSGGAP